MGNGVKYETEIRRIGESQTSDMQAMFDNVIILYNMQRRYQLLLVENTYVQAKHFDTFRISEDHSGSYTCSL